ncbi:MAG: hypothetical protein OEM91_02115 [Hyphomicrobiales bacterium]|nr:hypothetical protein [Hyphomicrobiales bacterium]
MRSRNFSFVLVAAAAILGGCTYEREGPPEHHLTDMGTQAPSKHAVSVCHAYGCQKTTRVVFSQKDKKAIAAVMRKTKKRDTPHEERRAVAYAISWMEIAVGKRIGTSADRPGMDFRGSGDATQQDCVDEATNTTSYLMFLDKQGLLKHHTVGIPFSKGRIWRGVKNWPHWTAVLQEKKGGQRWAVDSWIYENGENPAVVKVDEWYIKDLENLSKPTT